MVSLVRVEYVFHRGFYYNPPYEIFYDYVGNEGDPFLVASEVDLDTGYYSTAFPNQRKLVRLSDGTLYVVYFKKLNDLNQVYVKKSTNEGVTWKDETRISTYPGMENYSNCFPSIAIDSEDNLHVVWGGTSPDFPNYAQIWYSKYTTSWSTPVMISTYPGMDSKSQRYPDIVVDSEGNLHVVWYGDASGFNWSQIWYAKYDGSWSTPIRISTYTNMEINDQYEPSIAIDSNGYLHVVWTGGAHPLYPDSSQIWYAKYTTSWVPPLRLSTRAGMESDNLQYTPSITIDSKDHIHVTWYGPETHYTGKERIWYVKYTTSWTTPLKISTYPGMDDNYQCHSTITVDSEDNPHVVWDGMATGYTDYKKIWYAKYTTSWQTPECLQPTDQNIFPVIAERASFIVKRFQSEGVDFQETKFRALLGGLSNG